MPGGFFHTAKLPIHVKRVWVETDDEDVAMVALEKPSNGRRLELGYFAMQTFIFVLVLSDLNNHDARRPLVKHKVHPATLFARSVFARVECALGAIGRGAICVAQARLTNHRCYE